MLLQIGVGPAEVLVPKESTVGGEWGWVRGGENQMPVPVDKLRLFLGEGSPQ
jgi:hypothetical protein